MAVRDIPANGSSSVSQQGQVTIPADVREELNIEKGDTVRIVADGDEFYGYVLEE